MASLYSCKLFFTNNSKSLKYCFAIGDLVNIFLRIKITNNIIQVVELVEAIVKGKIKKEVYSVYRYDSPKKESFLRAKMKYKHKRTMKNILILEFNEE